jgi:hypothetical protein
MQAEAKTTQGRRALEFLLHVGCHLIAPLNFAVFPGYSHGSGLTSGLRRLRQIARMVIFETTKRNG